MKIEKLTRNIIQGDEKRYGKLIDFEINDEHENILILGLNPGGDEEEDLGGLLYLPGNKNDKLHKLLSSTNGDNYLPRYYKPLYEIFTKGYEKEEFTMFWSCNERIKETVKKMIEKKEKQFTEKEKKQFVDEFEKIYMQETKKKGPYLIFGDLVYYHTSKAHELQELLKGQDLNKYIGELFEIFINKYNPKLILVNSKVAAEYIQNSLDIDKKEEKLLDLGILIHEGKNKFRIEKYSKNKQIPIIFTADTTQYLDILSKARLRRQITEVWENTIKK